MDVLRTCLLLTILGTSNAYIWLTINDEEVSSYANAPNIMKPIKILCHQQVSDGYSIIPKRSILRAVTNLRSQSDLQSLAAGSTVTWNQTYSLDSVETLAADPLRAVLNEIYNPSPDYLVSGYTLIAPLEEDSSIYKCQGFFQSLNGIMTAENTLWVVVSITGSSIVTSLTINNDVVPDYYRKSPDRGLSFRCRTYIPGNAGQVLLQRIYKAQNMTTLNLRTMKLEYRFTGYELVYDSNASWYKRSPFFAIYGIPVRQTSLQELSSGCDITAPRTWHTGFYYCTALYEAPNRTIVTMDSDVVFLDERRLPSNILRFKTEPVTRDNVGNINFLAYERTTFTSLSYKSDTGNAVNLTAVCYISSWDYIAEAKMVIGDIEYSDLEVIALDEPLYLTTTGDTDVHHTARYWAAVYQSFHVEDICSWPFVRCNSWIAGRPDRQGESFLLEMVSSLCSHDKAFYLKSKCDTLVPSASILYYPLATYLWHLYR